MSVDAQKLELITLIARLNDKGVLDQPYLQVKKTLEAQKVDGATSSAFGEKANSESPQSAPGCPLQLLEQSELRTHSLSFNRLNSLTSAVPIKFALKIIKRRRSLLPSINSYSSVEKSIGFGKFRNALSTEAGRSLLFPYRDMFFRFFKVPMPGGRV